MSDPRSIAQVEAAARKAINDVVVTDIHTHLFPPSHGHLLLWGMDELLTFHYLVSELFTVAPRDLTPEKYWALPKARQADLVWKYVFIENSPISEAARGLLTTLNCLGIDAAKRDLAGIRKWFARQKIRQYLPEVFKLAGMDYAVMTNDPFQAEEVEHWNAGGEIPDCFKTALRIDTMLVNWPAAAAIMRDQGYKTAAKPDAGSFSQARKFLTDWARRIKPVYFAASLPPNFAYPSKNISTAVLDNVVMPVAQELALPMATMIGVRKLANPRLRLAGDGVGVSDVTALQGLCLRYPKAKFLATLLSRVNQHELCVLARKFGQNLHLFGCWWFCNTPSIIDEMTRMRIELLGTAVTLQHSDARVLEQVIYKWNHSRRIIADVLADKYRDLFIAGWRPSMKEIQRDARNLLGGGFERFIAG